VIKRGLNKRGCTVANKAVVLLVHYISEIHRGEGEGQAEFGIFLDTFNNIFNIVQCTMHYIVLGPCFNLFYVPETHYVLYGAVDFLNVLKKGWWGGGW
jgi:hypothetical protein